MYKVQPFIWQNIIQGETMFQTKNSTVIITDEKLINFLIDIENENIIEIDDRVLNKYFIQEEKVRIIDFLLENGIIKREKKKKIDVRRVILLSNDKKFERSMVFNLKDILAIDILEMEYFENYKFGQGDLLLIFLNPFQLKHYEMLSTKVKEKDVLTKFIFSYNNRIYFSNFYKKSWYNPCPSCFFSALESQLRGENSENDINFQTIIDLLYAQKAEFCINLPLDSSAYLQITYLLSKYLYRVPQNYKIDEVMELNLEDYSVNRDTAYHWGYCDCYE